MAPSRKSKSVTKRFSNICDVVSNEDKKTENVSKTRLQGSPRIQKKRKLADMLGPQWRKEELERFYEAFRKYGTDWKKVATALHNRSMEMVEALYSMNRAYLSLPEGLASVVGLIAMMRDHYTVLDGSDSEQKSIEDAETFRKPPKVLRLKRSDATYEASDGHFSDHSQSHSVSSGDVFLSLLKKSNSGTSSHAVRNRTPRGPVAHSIQMGGSSKVSGSPNSKTKGIVSSPGQNSGRKVTDDMAKSVVKSMQPSTSKKQSRQLKVVQPSGMMTSCNGKVSSTDKVNLANKVRQKRKMGEPKSMLEQDITKETMSLPPNDPSDLRTRPPRELPSTTQIFTLSSTSVPTRSQKSVSFISEMISANTTKKGKGKEVCSKSKIPKGFNVEALEEPSDDMATRKVQDRAAMYMDLKYMKDNGINLDSWLAPYEKWIGLNDMFDEKVVKVFYSNLKVVVRKDKKDEMVGLSFNTTVRGQQIFFDSESLNNDFGITEPQFNIWVKKGPFPEPQLSEIYSFKEGLERKPASMPDAYRILHYVYSRIMVSRCGSFSTISNIDNPLLPSLIKKEPINPGMVICLELYRFLTDKSKSNFLPFPQLVSFLLRINKVWYVDAEEKKIKQVTMSTLKKMGIKWGENEQVAPSQGPSHDGSVRPEDEVESSNKQAQPSLFHSTAKAMFSEDVIEKISDKVAEKFSEKLSETISSAVSSRFQEAISQIQEKMEKNIIAAGEVQYDGSLKVLDTVMEMHALFQSKLENIERYLTRLSRATPSSSSHHH